MAESHNGKTPAQLTAYLQSRGWTHERARHFVHNSLHAEGLDESPRTTEMPTPQQHMPAWMPVLFWLSALTGLLWLLMDVAGRLPT